MNSRMIQYLLVDTGDKKSLASASKVSELAADLASTLADRQPDRLGQTYNGQPEVVIAIDRVAGNLKDFGYVAPYRADSFSRTAIRWVQHLLNHEGGHAVRIVGDRSSGEGIMNSDIPTLNTFLFTPDSELPDFGVKEDAEDVDYWVKHRF